MVEKAYELYPSTKINRIWLTLMSCMNEILLSGGEVGDMIEPGEVFFSK